MTTVAHLVCLSFTFIYVAGFYVFSVQGDRNSPNVIRARMKSVMLASLLSALMVWYYLQATTDYLWVALGIRPVSWYLLSPLFLTVLLFLGPLSVLYFDRELPFQTHCSFSDIKAIWTSLIGQRNYCVGPLTEEFVFRACMIAVLFHAGMNSSQLIFISPLYFGVAHVHHAWNTYVQLGKTHQALKRALFSSLFQFVYTSIFGWYESYLFLRLGSLWPPVLCHSFCNMMGFPDLDGFSYRPKYQKYIIASCFISGLVLFIYYFSRLTHPDLVGGSMYWP
ncbi:CAAX prenyl protease 2 [Choanephora cucurbitarum]|uniref:intramembrane prenyl-peptidase Rce1 n=1 Tax=Choanephora cucurbitarum TaxID=101091 RepID=A0A1C7NRQ3_9FUNG|nr:CAAX prenyl protease 2 [Choanephora cucurbitarum]